MRISTDLSRNLYSSNTFSLLFGIEHNLMIGKIDKDLHHKKRIQEAVS